MGSEIRRRHQYGPVENNGYSQMTTIITHGRPQGPQVWSDDHDRYVGVLFLIGPDRAVADGA